MAPVHITAGDDDTGAPVLRARAGEAGGVLEARRQDGLWRIQAPDGGAGRDVAGVLLGALVAACRESPGAVVDWWVPAADGTSDALARDAGLEPDRDVVQLRRPLPADPPPALAVRPFVPGQDEEAWLAVNNAAFTWHEDQSDWTRRDLETRMAEPWFDPDGFLLHESGGRLLGFCWTKVHAQPPLGEIYVIAVHPEAHGRGLGRALVLAGLAHLAARGLRTGMLYVEADNDPALGLYRALGFHEHQRDRRYRAGGTAHPVTRR